MKKNKSGSKTKAFFNRVLKIRQWSDWDRVKNGGQFIQTGIKKVFVASPSKPTETFEEATKRLNLNQEALATRAHALFRLSILMLILSVSLLIYAVYHVFYGTWHAALLTVSLASIAAVFSFRYHFWYFQIKSQKLGCSISEWYHQGLKGDKS